MTRAQLLHKVATDNNLPIDVVEKIISSEFKLVYEVIHSGTLETVNIKYFGKFCVKDGTRLIRRKKVFKNKQYVTTVIKKIYNPRTSEKQKEALQRFLIAQGINSAELREQLLGIQREEAEGVSAEGVSQDFGEQNN